MVSIVEWLLVLNTFKQPPKSWLLNKSGYISREVNNGARTVLEFCQNWLSEYKGPVHLSYIIIDAWVKLLKPKWVSPKMLKLA